MAKKLAFLIMDPNCDPSVHNARFETGSFTTTVATVRNMEEALQKAEALYRDGVGVIEICGAFGEEGAREIIRVTEGNVGVGYVVHLPEQDKLFGDFFAGL